MHIKKYLFAYFLFIVMFMTIFFSTKIFASQATNDSFLSLPSHAGFDNSVYITTLQNDRKILVGGEFTTYDGTTANKIIRLFSDGRRDSSFVIGSGFNDAVRAITIQDDGKILVGGHFTDYNGVTANRIIRLNPNGSVDTSFTIGSGFNAQVRTIELQADGKMLVGGAIVNYSGTTIYRIVRLNANGSIDTSFNVGLGFNNNIRSIVFQEDGKIILGGGFVIYSGTVTNRIIRLNPDGSRDTSFIIGAGFNDQINMVVMQSDGKILVGGLFTGYNGTSVNRIARLNPNGSIDTSFAIGNGFDAQIVSLITYNNKIIVGGAFTSYNGTSTNRIVRLNDDGSIDTSFDIGIGYNNTVRSLSFQSDGKILVGGDFTGYQSTAFGRLMRLHGESNISLLDTDNEDAIRAEFLSKGYTLSQSVLSGSAPMVFIDTEGRVPMQLTLKNKNILLTLPKDMGIKKSSTMTDYTGIFIPPTFIANSKSDTISTIQVGSSTTGLSLVNGLATLSVPVNDAVAGDLVEIFYSEDNGNNWYTHTKTFVDTIDGQAYVSFTTDHFTDFAISTPLAMTGSFTINDDDISTTSQNVTLNISTTPIANQMRFSNDGVSRSTREAYATNKAWTLSAGTGTKTVYVQFDTNGDDISDVETSDEIEYNNGNIPSGYCRGGGTGNFVTLCIVSSEIGYCEYGDTLDFGNTGYSSSSREVSSPFTTFSGNDAWFCNDTQGALPRTLSIQSSDLVNMSTNNPNQTISGNKVFIKNPTAQVVQGVCIANSGSSLDSRTSIGTDMVILGKLGGFGNVCKVETSQVDLKIDIPSYQAIGQYSGVLTITVPSL